MAEENQAELVDGLSQRISDRSKREQAKEILSKQANKIATKAEEHERIIFKIDIRNLELAMFLLKR